MAPGADIFANAPNQSQDDRTPSPYQVWDVKVTFRADRGGDASGTVTVRLGWDRVADDGRENELLQELWRLWYAQMLKQAQETVVDVTVVM